MADGAEFDAKIATRAKMLQRVGFELLTGAVADGSMLTGKMMDDAQQRYDGGDDIGPSAADRQEIILRPMMRPVPGPLQSPPLASEEGKGLFNQLYRRATKCGNKIAGLPRNTLLTKDS